MAYSAQSFSSDIKKTNCIVDYHNNQSLSASEVSFHWWTNESTSLHCHNFYEFFIITDNKALHEINGVTDELGKGTLCMIRPNDCHRFLKTGEGSCVHMNLCVTPRKLEEICGAVNISLSEIESSGALQVSLSPEELSLFAGRARLLNLLMEKSEQQRIAVICGLISLAVSVIDNSKIVEEFNYPLWFAKLLEEIHSPENNAICANDVYKLGGFSPPAMVEHFKRYTGKTVTAYLRDMKCARACSLLRSTDLSIVEISGSLGYESLSHFNRIFKAYTGMSPTAYRSGKGEETM